MVHKLMRKLEHLGYVVGMHCVLIMVVFMRPLAFIKAVKKDGLVADYNKSIEQLKSFCPEKN